MENNNQDKVKHEHEQAAAQTKKPANGAVIALVIAIILAIAAIGGTWYYMKNQAKNDKKAQDEQIQKLQKQVDELKKQGVTKTDKPTTTTTKTVDEVVAQIVKDVPAKNYAGLSDYMADTVKVVIAASEYQPSVTKAQAIVDMEYLNGGVSPWDFDPTAAELNSYKTGDYKTYLNSAGIFGVASNGYFVAFTLNGSNQISQIFMAVNVELIN